MTNELITISPAILADTPVFKGTRVPIESLFDHQEGGASLDNFLEDFSSVSRGQAVKVLSLARSVPQTNLKLPD